MGCTCFRNGDVKTVKSNKLQPEQNKSSNNENRNQSNNRVNSNINNNSNHNLENQNNERSVRRVPENMDRNLNLNDGNQNILRNNEVNIIQNIESPRRFERRADNLQNTENRENNRNDNRESIALNLNRVRNNIRTNISNNVVIENEPYLESRNDPFFNFEEIDDYYVGRGIKKTKAFVCPISREELDKKIVDFWDSRRDNSKEIWEILRIICCKDIDNGKNF